MRKIYRLLSILPLLAIPVCARSSPPLRDEQSISVAFAQAAGIRAVNFHQGDAKSLNRARRDFTAAGWKDFTQHMTGYIDQKGAPVFNSSFQPSGDAEVLGIDKGIVHIRIPGTLIQSSGLGRTTYRAAIEVYAGGRPPRITRLEQITCVDTRCR